ncbi:transmembrane and TPR repeat-containing protein [Tropilaelaps mercedesae]|uniref:dolichyl-phosphate-mannose--protein mannosyltransferase n=1 Tax=Tropilaelaps mercedesae TaxID=418985 RepID=A0A1V9X6U0_9ACAR|nr:transmembrane and TPR repeat-containing protein [Tropilaelaps mercedesae]
MIFSMGTGNPLQARPPSSKEPSPDKWMTSASSTSNSPRSSPLRRPQHRTLQRWHMLLVAGISCAVYLNALSCGFVFDDVSAIRDNKDLRAETPLYRLFLNDFWGTPMHKEHSHKSYRPLTVFTFRLNYALHGLQPLGYHLTNVLLHAGVSCLLMLVVVEFVSPWNAFVTGVLFAVHPIHTEAVTGVVGRAEALCAIFFLASFIAYKESQKRRPMLVATVILIYLATLCKEQGITAIGVLESYELLIFRRLRPQTLLSTLTSAMRSISSGVPSWLKISLTRCGCLALAGAAFMYLRIKVMGAQLPVFTKFDNPAAAASFPTRQLTYNYLLPVNVWLLLNPYHLCCDWTMGSVPLVESLLDHRNLFTLAVYAVAIAVAYSACLHTTWEQYRAIVFATTLVVFPFLPASNLLFPVGFVVAERVLYLPSMGFCLLVAFGCGQLRLRRKALADVLLVVVVLSELTIFRSGLKVNVQNAKLFNNIGHALEQAGSYGKALRYFLKAVEVQADDVGAHINVGRTYTNLQMYTEAEEAYLRAKALLPRPRKGEKYQTRIAPNYLNVFLNLANLYARNSSRLEEADALYRQAISMRTDYIQAYINRGDVLIKLNRTLEAWHVYERALQLDQGNPDIYYNMGVVLIELGKSSDALQYFEKALHVSPDHEQALMNSAILIQESGNAKLRQVAVARLNQLLQRGHDNERIWFNLAMLATDNKQLGDAERFFKLALKHKPAFRSALFNLALLLSDVGRPLDAKPYLERLLAHHPNHSKALILLGDIFINQLKDTARAKECYERILAVEPANVQAMHNLCVVYVNSGRLDVAERCLVEVQKRAPKEGYVQKHLHVVRKRLENLRRDGAQQSKKSPT